MSDRIRINVDDYDDERELDRYIDRHLYGYMNDIERQAWELAKLRHGAAMTEDEGIAELVTWRCANVSPEVIKISELGVDTVIKQVQDRIRVDVSKRIVSIHRCPE